MDGLKAVGADSSFSNRKAIAAANGISNYSGTAVQNTALLSLLKLGKLRKPGSSSGTGSGSGSGSDSGPSTGTLEVYSNYNVSVSSKAAANKPHYKNAEGKRGRDAYNTVINQFNVNTNSRYAATSKSTYCNIFAWDVMSAMKVQLPHWIYNSGKNRGKPAEPFASGAHELNANATYNWLNNYGAAYGWKKVSAADAQKRANSGYPTVVIWKNPTGASGHVAVVRPEGNGYGYSSSNGPVTAQAGAQNKNYLNVKSGFGASRMSSVVYWTHN